MKARTIATILLLTAIPFSLFAQEGSSGPAAGEQAAETDASTGEPAAEPAAELAAERAAPAGYGLLMFGEFFLPGSAHLAMGDKGEGILELSLSLPLIGLGQGLIWYYYLAPRDGEPSPFMRNGYPYGRDEWFLERRWMLELGLALDAAGRAVAAYSAWTAHRDYLERYGGAAFSGSDSPGKTLAAPFLPENLFSPDVIPVIALVGICSFLPNGLEKARDFFAEDSQPFCGANFHPGTALGLKLSSALIVSLFSAIAREAAFRGLALERDGLAASIALSGSSSLVSMIVPGASAGALALRAASEAAYSWYSGALARREGNLGKAIALRYWCETITSVLDFLADPEAAPPLQAGITVRY